LGIRFRIEEKDSKDSSSSDEGRQEHVFGRTVLKMRKRVQKTLLRLTKEDKNTSLEGQACRRGREENKGTSYAKATEVKKKY
jgi:hypothetical protein